MTISVDLKPLQRALRSEGFRRTDRGRSTCNPDCQIYMRGNIKDFCLEVQLWGDGGHRVAHWQNSRQTVRPTEFSDVPGLKTAIAEQEAYRKLEYQKREAAQ